jgi:hypothetical protein
MKTLKISDLCYELLLDASKKARKKPEEYIEQIIKSTILKTIK